MCETIFFHILREYNMEVLENKKIIELLKALLLSVTIFLFLVITFLYPVILPYNYGGFIDNMTLISAKSLTEFSPFYYFS